MGVPRETGWKVARVGREALFLITGALVMLCLVLALDLFGAFGAPGTAIGSAAALFAILAALSAAIIIAVFGGAFLPDGQAEAGDPKADDPLTGLPDRRLLAAMLEGARGAADGGEAISVLVINLDRFKPINDIFGHDAGDTVLQTAAERLRRIVGAERAGVAHLGSDEFACFITHGLGADPSTALAGRILEEIAAPIAVGGRTVEVGASIGIARDPGGGADDLLRAAGVAMSRAKRSGGAGWRVFEPAMDFDLRDRAELEADLRAGIAQDELLPFYQPIFSLSSADLVGFESLARWHHPSRGMLDPAIFIPIAEDLDAINDLCFTLLRQACRDARRWPAHLTLSINISPIQLCDPDLPLKLLQILYAGALAPGRLIVEITESALVREVVVARATIASLRNAGVKVALDDFGTGYSSLHHLRELQFDRIKIDRSFIRTLDSFAGDKIVRAIIELGHSLGMPVTAEGVETIEQAGMLSRLGCTYGQGFLFGRPMPAAAARAIIGDVDAENGIRRAAG